MRHGCSPALLLAAALGSLGACTSVTDPVASRRFDGHYVGTRRSDKTLACGIAAPEGTTSASISRGHVNVPLFGPRTRLDGTVGADGRLRASGIWPNPHGGYPGITVLNGQIDGASLTGEATDFRCHTHLDLRKTVTPLRPHKQPADQPPHRAATWPRSVVR